MSVKPDDCARLEYKVALAVKNLERAKMVRNKKKVELSTAESELTAAYDDLMDARNSLNELRRDDEKSK